MQQRSFFECGWMACVWKLPCLLRQWHERRNLAPRHSRVQLEMWCQMILFVCWREWWQLVLTFFSWNVPLENATFWWWRWFPRHQKEQVHQLKFLKKKFLFWLNLFKLLVTERSKKQANPVNSQTSGAVTNRSFFHVRWNSIIVSTCELFSSILYQNEIEKSS